MVKQLTQTNSLDLNIFTLLQRLNKAVKKTRKKNILWCYELPCFIILIGSIYFRKALNTSKSLEM